MNIEKYQNQEINFGIVPKTKAKNWSQLKLQVLIKVGPIKPRTIGQENLTWPKKQQVLIFEYIFKT
jgi:hypothetical protein